MLHQSLPSISSSQDSRQLSLDEIDLYELWRTLVKYKFVILVIMLFSMTVGLFYALMTPSIYKATVTLLPAIENQDRMSGIIGQIGSIAAIGGVGMIDPMEKMRAIFKSRRFVEHFIKKNQLMPILYEKQWDQIMGNWQKQLNPKEIPTTRDAAESFAGIFTIDTNKGSSVEELSVEWSDPTRAAEWANKLVITFNQYMGESQINDARKSIDYLQKQLRVTDSVELQQVLYRLIEDATKTIMLAAVTNEAVYKVLDSAVPPKMKDRPNRKRILILSIVIGLIVGILIAFFIEFIKKQKPPKIN